MCAFIYLCFFVLYKVVSLRSTEMIEFSILGKLHNGLGLVLGYFLSFPTPSNTELSNSRSATANTKYKKDCFMDFP